MNEYELIASFSLKTGHEFIFAKELAELIKRHGETDILRLYKRGAGERVMLKNELIDEIGRLNTKVSELQKEATKWRTVAKSKKLR